MVSGEDMSSVDLIEIGFAVFLTFLCVIPVASLADHLLRKRSEIYRDFTSAVVELAEVLLLLLIGCVAVFVYGHMCYQAYTMWSGIL